MLKWMMLGALAFSFAAMPVFAADEDDDEQEEVAPKKKAKKKAKKGKKAPAPMRMFVAIQKFENKAGVEANQFETIRARVQQCVVGARKFEVVEREQLKEAMSEQKLAAAGVTDGDDPTAPEAGKMKAASYIIYGNILFCGADKAGGAAEGVASAVSKSKVELQIKITNGETGKILTQKSAIGYGVDKAMASENFKSQSGQGMRDAIDEACHMAADALRDVAYPAKVVKVGKKDISLNMTDEEVKEGDVFDLIEAEDPVYDPDTGSCLGADGDDVGRVVITRVGPQMSKAKPTKDADGETVSLEDIDLDEHSYIVRRVSKEKLMKEAKQEHRRHQREFENRF